MDELDELEIAATDLSILKSMHNAFMKTVNLLETKMVKGGEISVQENELAVTCLGIGLHTRSRHIARNGKLMAIEYAFFARNFDQELKIWSMYLERDKELYSDLNAQKKVCRSLSEFLCEGSHTTIMSFNRKDSYDNDRQCHPGQTA